MLVQKEQATLNVCSSYEKEHFCYKVRVIIIADNSVRIMFLYLSFNDYDFIEVISNFNVSFV